MLLEDHRVREQLPELHPFARMIDPPFTTILVCENEELENSENLSEQDADVTLRDALCEIGEPIRQMQSPVTEFYIDQTDQTFTTTSIDT